MCGKQGRGGHPALEAKFPQVILLQPSVTKDGQLPEGMVPARWLLVAEKEPESWGLGNNSSLQGQLGGPS